MEQKTRGLISYLFGIIGGLIVLFKYQDNTYDTNYHACQAIVLCGLFVTIEFISFILITVLTSIMLTTGANISVIITILTIMNYLLSILYVILSIIGMIKAHKEKEYRIPGVSKLAESIFRSKIG